MPRTPNPRRGHSDLSLKGVPPDVVNALIRYAADDRCSLTAEIILGLREYIRLRREREQSAMVDSS